MPNLKAQQAGQKQDAPFALNETTTSVAGRNQFNSGIVVNKKAWRWKGPTFDCPDSCQGSEVALVE
jgi:hypothetical protein